MRKIHDYELAKILPYMSDAIRESVHFDIAPCTETEFLAEYLKRDPDFEPVVVDLIGEVE